MIRTSANTENIIWVNASRNKTLSSPTYMMGITHQVNQNFIKRFIPNNITSISGTTIDNPRADLFKFGINDGVENLTGGTTGGTTNIIIEDYGWYYYRIYEQTSPTNLNPLYATDVVDEGILYIIPPDTTEITYTGYSNNNITIYE